MDISVVSTALNETETDWLVVPVFDDDSSNAVAQSADSLTDGVLTRLRESGDLNGKLAEVVVLPDVPSLSASRLMLLGLGKLESLSTARLNKALMTSVRSVTGKKPASLAIAIPEDIERLPAAEFAQAAAVALNVGSSGQGLYKSEPSRHPLQAAMLVASADIASTLDDAVLKGTLIGESINVTRELVNRPAADIYPESVAERAASLAEEYSISCRIMDEDEIAAENMGSLSQVAVGSDRPPRIVVLEHMYGGKDAPTIAFVGKGVTFDSGGLSMKSSDGMMTMKSDMAGSATVLGAVIAIARLGLSVNVVGYLGLVENMVSGRSYKLGDVLTARNGTTIEVHNTDAEGRLVLADVLSYAVDHGADQIIDLATLTGACVVALGEDVTGVFSNDQDWCDKVLESARSCGEDAWQLPMFDHYDDLLKSDVADCKNIGGRWGGAITAAKFLQKFVAEKPWVHLDIAGPSFASGNKAHREGGATGCMVRTLIDVAEKSTSKK